MIATVSRDAIGVIFQTAGKGSSTDYFVTNLQRKHPMPRGIWAAADGAAGAQARDSFVGLVKQVESEINTKLGGLR